MTEPNWKQFFMSLGILVIIHSVVSIVAYRGLTQEVVESRKTGAPVEITTSEQRNKGEASFMLTSAKVVTYAVPLPVLLYMWSGYIGLSVALIIATYRYIFPK